LIGFLPSNNTENPPFTNTGDDPGRISEDLLDIVPAQSYKPFDMREIIQRVVDNNRYFELKKDYARNLTTGLARLNGQTVGIVGNNSIFKSGCYDISASEKHARFVRFCDAFNVPLVFFSDNPGFYPSVEEEQQGILRHGTMVVHANAEATVPKITLYIRKCYGGGNLGIPGNWLEIDREIAWPSVERGIMGAKEGASIIWRKDIAQAKTSEEAEKIRQEGIGLLEKRIEINSRAWNDEIIDPRQTRSVLIGALKSLANKSRERPWRKHENMNL
jgi:acetyl-CoA carboxylase carboxyltransferase component